MTEDIKTVLQNMLLFFFLLCVLLLQTSCVRCLLDLPPTTSIEISIPIEISTKKLFAIIQEASKKANMRITYPKVTKYDIKSGIIEIGEKGGAIGLRIKAQRKGQGKILRVTMGGYNIYCSNMDAKKSIINLTGEIKEKISKEIF